MFCGVMPRRDGGVAVDDEIGFQAVELLVAGDVDEDVGVLLHLGDELVGPDGKLGGAGVFNGVLVFGAADAVFDGEVLRGLQIGLDAVDVGRPLAAGGR